MTKIDETMLKRILEEVECEFRRATDKFGAFASTHEGYAIIKEELDELWDAVKKNDAVGCSNEVIQVAAMAVRFKHDMWLNAVSNYRSELAEDAYDD